MTWPAAWSVLRADVALLTLQRFSGKESSGACPAFGRVGFADAAMRGNRQVSSHYLTALIVSVKVPDGTLTVTLSPFLWPTRARPTGESTEILPADGLEGFLQPLAGLGTAAQGHLEISLQLLEALRRQQNRFG